MKKKKDKKTKQKLNTMNRSISEERKERISNGTWMGRGTVFASKKTYNRKRLGKPEEE